MNSEFDQRPLDLLLTDPALSVLRLAALYADPDGKLEGDGFIYKNYSGAISGLFNFYEFSGFANATWKHLIMMLVGLYCRFG